MNLVDEVMNNSNKEDEDEILNIPKVTITSIINFKCIKLYKF